MDEPVTGDLSALFRLDGRVVLITGAAGPVGQVLARAAVASGADAVLVDLPSSSVADLAADLRTSGGGEVSACRVDLAAPGAVDAIREHLISRGVVVDVLVNNAALTGTSGVSGYAVPFPLQTIEAFDVAAHLNLAVPFALAQLVHQLAAGVDLRIVNVASIYGLVGPSMNLYEGTSMGNPAAYAASKGGLIQLTRYLATVLAPSCRVNAIAPGGVLRGQPAQFVERYSRSTPMGRMAGEDDMVGPFLFLASDASRYVTGQVLAVDGGWTAW